MSVHKEDESDCGLSAFVEFLVNSPLQVLNTLELNII